MPDPATIEEPILQLRDLRKQFGDLEVLKGVSIEVRQGEVIAIVGVSGSGKSTLLRCVNLLEIPTGGEILFDGKRVPYESADSAFSSASRAISRMRAEIGMVFQQFNLWPHKSVIENVIEAPITVRKVPRDQAIADAEHLLDSIGLLEKRDEYPIRLSGGQQQRVAIVRALAMKPKLMLFDEATSALDPELIGEVLGLIAKLAEDGMTMMVVTHEIHFARQVSNRTIFIDAGRIEEEGPSREVLNNPRSDRTRQFLDRVLHDRGVE